MIDTVTVSCCFGEIFRKREGSPPGLERAHELDVEVLLRNEDTQHFETLLEWFVASASAVVAASVGFIGRPRPVAQSTLEQAS